MSSQLAVGDLKVSNISIYFIFLMRARARATWAYWDVPSFAAGVPVAYTRLGCRSDFM
jgi:hypothetical protein